MLRSTESVWSGTKQLNAKFSRKLLAFTAVPEYIWIHQDMPKSIRRTELDASGSQALCWG